MLPDRSRRTLAVTEEHLAITRRGIAELGAPDARLMVDAPGIEAFVRRSGDRYVWHVEPGSAYRESALLQERMHEAGLDRAARLAHGVLGLIYGLRAAYLRDPATPIRGLEDVRFLVPVFEGASLSVVADPPQGGVGRFAVTTSHFQGPAISGQLLYGSIPDDGGSELFTSPAEQQHFTLEEAMSLVSALIGLWGQDAGVRMLYMSQTLRLQALLARGETLEATGEIVERRPGRRRGERARARVSLSVAGSGREIASGESTFLYGAEGL
ncbi:MAG: hypothetical protein JOZ41_14325 [Chloroflexi bacterium]|nr:hypothetical protein [Chloroflexota bacterium]